MLVEFGDDARVDALPRTLKHPWQLTQFTNMLMNSAKATVSETANPVNFTSTQLFNFWAKVDKNGPIQKHSPELGRCWIWTAATGRAGYGYFGLEGRTNYCHRVSWMIHFGEIPDRGERGGIMVLHKCDNRACINPDHLFIGTHIENMEDMVSKQRTLKGIKHHNAKLTDRDSTEIRKSYFTGKFKMQELALDFGVSKSTIFSVVHLKTWKMAAKAGYRPV